MNAIVEASCKPLLSPDTRIILPKLRDRAVMVEMAFVEGRLPRRPEAILADPQGFVLLPAGNFIVQGD